LEYGVITEPGNDHGYIYIDGDFISNTVFISQSRLGIPDIIVCNERDWFIIKNINIKDQFHFEYVGERCQPNDAIQILLLQKGLDYKRYDMVPCSK
jgi:hypothetical protein